MKAHLQDCMKALAAEHTNMAAYHLGRMEDTNGDTKKDHERISKSHAAMATACLNCNKALESASTEANRGGSGDVSTGANFDGKVATGSSAARMADDLARSFDNLQPTSAHRVLGDVPDSSLRLVNRAGGAPINTGDPSLDLDEQLRKITAA